MKNQGAGRLVYSTEVGRMCPECRQPVAACSCAAQAAATKAAQARARGDGIARVQRETQGRGGKTVTVVRGLPLDAEALAALGKQLRAACGTGGTVRDGVLELQGDQADKALAWLAARGFAARRSG